MKIAYISVGENYDLAWWVRPQVAKKEVEWYHFKRWDPAEIEFTIRDLLEQDYEVYEVYNSNIDNKMIKRNVATGIEEAIE